MTAARFVAGSVEAGYALEGGGPVYSLRATYSYTIGAFRYAGEYTANVCSEEEGAQILRSLETGPLWVRHHPSRPDESVLDPYRDVTAPR